MENLIQIFFDPSVNNTGWCITSQAVILASGVIRTKAEKVQDRLKELGGGVNMLLSDEHLGGAVPATVLAVVEIPAKFSYHRSSGRGGKALNSASIQKLNMAAGTIMTVLGVRGCKVDTIEAHVWKGSRGKKLDQAIACNLVGRRVGPDEADAIMLAQWWHRGALRAAPIRRGA
jgi:hypothetical protein